MVLLTIVVCGVIIFANTGFSKGESTSNKKIFYLDEPKVDLGFDVNAPTFKEVVIEDVKNSFSEDLKALENTNNVYEYDFKVLQKAGTAIGKMGSHLRSLQSLFEGVSYGERRLYIVSGQQPTKKYDNAYVGYLLYKKPNGTDVLKKLRRGEKEWEVVEVKEKKLNEQS